ncbi:hypothetical protein C8P63_10385 [Melghirimyces profundicolus]|uniref:Uncharacterized protein n=1 Tax=Melghirimyces profundicolus TaxID=1242148 RepID=A0A2T6C7N0_9BACL|nr:hypothetical protein [Melghirimyces profundicolus]PTX64302.1 hypothetical protein C8P63_10385 [Melghirimyces profundicolus]
MSAFLYALIGTAVGSWATGWLLYRHLHRQVKVSQSMIRELQQRLERDFWRRLLLEFYAELIHFHRMLGHWKQSGKVDPAALEKTVTAYGRAQAKAEFLFSEEFHQSVQTMAESFHVMVDAIRFHQDKPDDARIDYDLDEIWEEANRRYVAVKDRLSETVDRPLSSQPGERFQV